MHQRALSSTPINRGRDGIDRWQDGIEDASRHKPVGKVRVMAPGELGKGGPVDQALMDRKAVNPKAGSFLGGFTGRFRFKPGRVN